MSDATEKGLSSDELDGQRAEQLPDREVMSLIGTDPAGGLLPGEDLGHNPNAGPATGSTNDATGAAHGAPSTTSDYSGLAGSDAEGSTSESDPTPIDDDRSEAISNQDSATATS